jgi:hypothetical protein
VRQFVPLLAVASFLAGAGSEANRAPLEEAERELFAARYKAAWRPYSDGFQRDEDAGFGVFRQGNRYALRGRRRLPEEQMQLEESKDGGWGYTDRHPGSKMEIPPTRLAEARATGLRITVNLHAALH